MELTRVGLVLVAVVVALLVIGCLYSEKKGRHEMAKRTVESKMVSWTVEANPAGDGWALVAHIGGIPTQLSMWYPSVGELVDALKGSLMRASSNPTDLAPAAEGATSPPIPLGGTPMPPLKDEAV